MDILERIVADKRAEVAAAKAAVPEASLRERLAAATKPLPFREALAASPHGIIAEFKRKSPSRGWIHADVEPGQVVPKYAAAGAAAVSILTDEPYFGGCLDYVVKMRPLVNVPILRKEFVIDRYQLVEARAAGADAVLLIASCLDRDTFRFLLDEAHQLGLQVLLEVHTIEELDYVTPEVDAVGVNNRHLGTFHTDVEVSFRMVEELCRRGLGGPGGPVLVSESGISKPETVRRLRAEGFRGFLMGECFMKEDDPGAALAAFIDAL
ncbi:MAG: indole-3-glycerol phosphate synthase TrpC [Bacteroidales bacterium]|nr:indole-3-glycerol phosphate synthase TrpC [Bacteroidales bacterium]